MSVPGQVCMQKPKINIALQFFFFFHLLNVSYASVHSHEAYASRGQFGRVGSLLLLCMFKMVISLAGDQWAIWLDLLPYVYWTWTLKIQLNWLANKYQEFSCLLSYPQHFINYRQNYKLALSGQAFMSAGDSDSQIWMAATPTTQNISLYTHKKRSNICLFTHFTEIIKRYSNLSIFPSYQHLKR